MLRVRQMIVLGALVSLGGAYADEPLPAPSTGPARPRVIEISVTPDGFEPTPITVKKGEPLRLVVTRKTKATCAVKFILDEAQISADLPLNKPVELSFTPQKSGTVRFGCAMGKIVGGDFEVQ